MKMCFKLKKKRMEGVDADFRIVENRGLSDRCRLNRWKGQERRLGVREMKNHPLPVIERNSDKEMHIDL